MTVNEDVPISKEKKMASVFSQIINGELPGRFVWKDVDVVCFLSIAPLRPGHTLVVPRREFDSWTELPAELLGRVMSVAQVIGQGVERAWSAPRSGLAIAGFEVPHCHVHVSPTWSMDDLDFTKVKPVNDPVELDDAAEQLRTALRELGHGKFVPDA
ncbi:HIT family protein [Nonomuraea rubra]|uniref:Diadenosine tetraphosphate (Ap4A) HIT family hydrolase n=1 Tax=Nonomuraea rubra TaxID=46180 RepID=A0A7X0TX21_9ACTN|nr:HIT family protein [Nonomuraea rubra]MBB6547127.1 diadenosine tetraphosphate (Ap4A) HIT family hydrolase [Nonomuraea rubra]